MQPLGPLNKRLQSVHRKAIPQTTIPYSPFLVKCLTLISFVKVSTQKQSCLLLILHKTAQTLDDIDTSTRMLTRRKRERKGEKIYNTKLARPLSTTAGNTDWHIHFGKLAISSKIYQLHPEEQTQEKCTYRFIYQKIYIQMHTAALFPIATNCKYPNTHQ